MSRRRYWSRRHRRHFNYRHRRSGVGYRARHVRYRPRKRRSNGIVRDLKRVYYSWPSRMARRAGKSMFRRAIHAGTGAAWHGLLGFANWFKRPW